MNISEFETTLNKWGQQRIPFLFIADFELKNPLAFRLSELNNEILFYINGITNSKLSAFKHVNTHMVSYPISFQQYQRKFDTIYKHLQYGDSYLTNLTIRTEVKIQASL